ncbi:dynamin family protein [Nocardioides zeae]|uniref:Dynamin family protein n=1 Tax=Nocardioides imazamoxiresistens TaxID=3231893 RepID=A0ABU3Q0K4_9ACTN|nr:dynamin family protein [Nocardioides zeae]MDT9595042.1 dynamin family protein [Nocardioides zeae]
MSVADRRRVLEVVDRLCEDLARPLPAAERAPFEAVRETLHAPLRVAVVGRVKAGKSTLVNALVGRRVAPTAAGECTQVVTWYTYGSPDRAEVHLRDGSTRPLFLENGAVPAGLDVPVAEVRRIVVHLQAGALRDLTLIDTPGLATLTSENEDATRRALLGDGSSTAAAGDADALLFAIREAERQDDFEFLRDFHRASGSLAATAVNALCVLTQADLFGSGDLSGGDPFAIAAEVAQRIAVEHPTDFSAVVPVSGLMAQTARTGLVSESLTRSLRQLAEADPVLLQLWRQVGPPEGVSEAEMTTLWEAVGPYGVVAGREHAGSGAAALRTWLGERSGVDAVDDAVRRQLLPRAHLIKAIRALSVLSTLASRLPDPDDARSRLEAAQLDPDLHPLAELRALRLLSAHAPTSPLLRRLETVVDDPARVSEEAGRGDRGDAATALRRASAYAVGEASRTVVPAEIEAARVLARSYQLLARRVAGSRV